MEVCEGGLLVKGGRKLGGEGGRGCYAAAGAPVKPGAHWQRLDTHSPLGALQPLGHAPREHAAPGQGQERRCVKAVKQGGEGGKVPRNVRGWAWAWARARARARAWAWAWAWARAEHR